MSAGAVASGPACLAITPGACRPMPPIDSRRRSSRREVAGSPRLVGMPASRAASHQPHRPGRSCQGTSSMPGSCGPLLRRPSTRLEATETIGISGKACERSTASDDVNRPGLSAARTATAGVGCPAMVFTAAAAACGLSASIMSASSLTPLRAMPSSRPPTAPIHNTRRRGRSSRPAAIEGNCAGVAIFPIVPRRTVRRQAGLAAGVLFPLRQADLDRPPDPRTMCP